MCAHMYCDMCAEHTGHVQKLLSHVFAERAVETRAGRRLWVSLQSPRP